MKRDYKNVCVLFFCRIYDESRISSVLLFINHHGRLYQVWAAGVVAGAEEQLIIITRTTSRLVTLPGHQQGSVTPTPHMLSLTALARELPGSTELGRGSCRSLSSCMMSPGLYFSTSFSRRFVIVTIQSTYLIIIINYIYNIYSISTISRVYLQYLQYIYNLGVLSIVSTVLLPGHVCVEAWVAPTPAHIIALYPAIISIDILYMRYIYL